MKGLTSNKNDRRDHVEQALRTCAYNLQSVTLTIMIILYRIRNNLFHGLISVDRMNELEANLRFASQALATIMEIGGSFLRNVRV